MASTDDIEFGLQLMNFGDPEYVYPDVLSELVRAADDAGFDAVTVGDHVAFPEDIPPEYPYNESGSVRHHSGMNVYEPFQLLSYFAGITDEVRLGTNLCVVPMRHPVLLAKNALVLDSLSGGRFDFGVGVGWSRNEFEVLDVPFEERGSRTDEFLGLFEEVCRDGTVAFDGTHHSIRPTGFHPRPVQDGGPPRWVGGHSGAAFRRLAEFGDGYLCPPGASPDDVATLSERAMDAWTDYDRDGTPSMAVLEYAHVDADGDGSDDDPLVGPPAAVVAGIEEFAERGVTRILFKLYRSEPPDYAVTPVEEQVKQIELLAEHVLPAFG